ncbi:biotin--protein ligase-like isoform X2 [Acanthaster planci]|uniref:Biotin--protein ligase-like isoform X2 n=1 Tax=Acanthaster planci TaxID=133434 RepID=A0A8B7ZCW1_ACAPL|nr:biotin--protein ligase-like isoform X2 [Acanthaster planci]
MLFTVCYAYLTFSTAWRDYRQKAKVMNALRCHGARASIAFRKILQEGTISEGDKMRASFLCETGEQPIISQLLGEKRGKQMLVVHPKQQVDLSKDWTSFIGTTTTSASPYRDPDPASSSSLDSVFVLLEAFPPKKDRQGRLNLRKVARERVVKLSGLTTPLAWKSGEPFGILVQASANNFGLVGSAYLEGVLELDDGLLVEQIVCVDTIGEPFSLINQDPKTPSPSPFPSASPFHRSPSGNSLFQRSGSSQKDVKPLRRKHSQEFIKKLEEQQRRLSRKSSSESSDLGSISVEMASPGLDDEVLVDIKGHPKFHLGEVEDVSSGDVGNGSQKPPNVLVYTGNDDVDDSRYKIAMTFLEKFLHRDRYVIYHLKPEQALAHPWADNCMLLLLLMGTEPIPDNTLKKFTDYVKSGGFLFLLKGQSTTPPKNPSVCTIEYSKALGDEVLSFRAMCLEDPPTMDLFPNGQVKVLAESQGNAVVAETSFEGSTGKILSSLVQFQLLSPENLVPDTEAFTELKQSNEARHQVIFDLLGRFGLKCATSELPELTVGYLLGVNERVGRAFMSAIQPSLNDGQLASRFLTMQFSSDPRGVGKVTPDLLPVITGQRSPQGGSFDFEVYKGNLSTKSLGNVVLYTEVVPTTMTLFESFMFKVPEDVGVVTIATRMTQGKGRGGNKWLGPIGCAMFSLHVRIPFGSELADKLPFLQHIASAAVVEAVRSIEGYQDMDLRLKWPNDIYYSDKMKLGGVIVNSSSLDNVFHAIIGCGFNVDNSDPTICINDLVRLHNKQTNSDLPLLTVEQLIARAVNQIESLIGGFQREGPKLFLETYYRRWLHSGCKVRLENESGPEVTVEGLDKSGFLLVRDQEGVLHSVQPDGNSFDMTKNLVLMKERTQ